MQRFKGEAEPAQPRHDPLRLAAAAVLLDIAYADGAFSPIEGGDVAGYLSGAFGLEETETSDLIRTADEFRTQTIDHFAVANFIRRNMSLEDRIGVVKAMWRVALADGKLSDYEHYLIRKIADLLGLEHHVMIETKVSVLNEKPA